jgi:hypothetical protein
MDSTWAQLLVGVLAVLGPFVTAALGAVVLSCTPLSRSTDGALSRRPRR